MFISIETPRHFLEACIEFGEKAKADLDKIGRLEILDEIEGWKRARLNVYYSNGLDIFQLHPKI